MCGGECAVLMRYEKEQCYEPVPESGLHGKPGSAPETISHFLHWANLR